MGEKELLKSKAHSRLVYYSAKLRVAVPSEPRHSGPTIWLPGSCISECELLIHKMIQ